MPQFARNSRQNASRRDGSHHDTSADNRQQEGNINVNDEEEMDAPNDVDGGAGVSDHPISDDTRTRPAKQNTRSQPAKRNPFEDF